MTRKTTPPFPSSSPFSQGGSKSCNIWLALSVSPCWASHNYSITLHEQTTSLSIKRHSKISVYSDKMQCISTHQCKSCISGDQCKIAMLKFMSKPLGSLKDILLLTTACLKVDFVGSLERWLAPALFLNDHVENHLLQTKPL